METTPKNLSTFAINQIAKQQSITTTPSLPWSKTFSFQNSKQWYFFSHLQAAQNTIHYCKTNNIPFLLIPNNHTPLYNTYEIYIDTSIATKKQYLTIIESILITNPNNKVRLLNKDLFYKNYYEIYFT